MSESISEPIPIPLIAGRYLLFDIDVITYLRSAHHISGTFIGGIPQIPQQTLFHGLPLQLMPEEAKLLVDREAAYIVDDAAWHKENFALEGDEKDQYVESVRSVGLEAKRIQTGAAHQKTEIALAENGGRITPRKSSAVTTSEDAADDPLFANESTLSASTHNVARKILANRAWGVTPTISYPASSFPVPQGPDPVVPSSYPLFAHIHSKDYYIMPGLRFGCHYNVYPGDPLRFHAHFQAVGYEWNEEISLLDLIGGGRLAGRVKKALLIGGMGEEETEKGDNVRTFSIEWGGM